MVAIVGLVVVATAFLGGVLLGMLLAHAALRGREQRLRRERQRAHGGPSRRAGDARPRGGS